MDSSGDGVGEVIRRPSVSRGPGPRVEILGVYGLEGFPLHSFVEARLPWRAGRVGLEMLTAPSSLDESGETVAEQLFYLSADGEDLLGARAAGYDPSPPPELPGPTRAVFLFIGVEYPATLRTPGGLVDVGEREPLPERLLRLVWIE